MSYVGIDYGSLQCTNRDLITGIHYGVISQHSVLQAWCDSAEPIYPEPELDEDGEPIEDDFGEAIGWEFSGEGYELTDCLDSDIFVLKSPYYTFAQFCSPCVPGAGNLDHPMPEGVKTYCLGHDWFDDGKAPYPVYDVVTNRLVEP